jgi:hypothetical protein
MAYLCEFCSGMVRPGTPKFRLQFLKKLQIYLFVKRTGGDDMK